MKKYSRLKAKKTADKIRAEWERPVKYIKYKPKKVRENVPPLELMWLKIKVGTRKQFKRLGGYVDSKINLAIEIGIKSLIAKFWWIGILVAIGMVILIGC